MLFATVSLAAALALGVAYAQAPPAGGPPPGAPPPGGAYGGQQGGQQGAAEASTPWPVIFVTSIEVLRAQHGGRDVVVARGLVSSSGWTEPRLVPITQGAPIDGVLDLLFEANAPRMPAPLGAFMEVDAMLPVGIDHPYKAIRVRSGANALTLKQLPGYVEVKKLKNDCTKCIGKFFVAKGGTVPTGVAADTILKEEDLLWEVRVIRHNQGIPNYTVNPNRLTLVLSEDGRIADAGWD
jgi:hypothetical protein